MARGATNEPEENVLTDTPRPESNVHAPEPNGDAAAELDADALESTVKTPDTVEPKADGFKTKVGKPAESRHAL
jgi:hypothetical protein